MKALLSGIAIFSGVLLFPSTVLAEALLVMEGTGSTSDAVKTFNRTVASKGGIVDNNSVTEYSSAGRFGKYQAILYSEINKEKKVVIRITVKPDKLGWANVLSPQTAPDMVIAREIRDSLEKAGYRNLTPEKSPESDKQQ